MNEDRFLISKYMKDFINNIDKVIINIPNKDRVIKDKLYITSYNILYLIYKANYSNNKIIRYNICLDILANINMLDFYLERCYVNKYLSKKQVLSRIDKLSIIIKMVYGWMNK